MLLAAMLLSGAGGVEAQDLSNLPRANEVVKPQGYVSLEPVPRGRTFEVAVVAQIAPGFHINANRVLEEYLIPTTIEAELPRGFKVLETIYPRGELQKFDFSEAMLSVYDGSVTLRMRVQALRDAPLGPVDARIHLRYQACNDRACLPPVRLQVPLSFRVAEAGAKARPAHPEVFRPRGSRRKA